MTTRQLKPAWNSVAQTIFSADAIRKQKTTSRNATRTCVSVVLVNTFNSAQNSPEKQNQKEKEKITANLRFQKSFWPVSLNPHFSAIGLDVGHCCRFPLRSRPAQRLFVQSHSLPRSENTIRAHCAARTIQQELKIPFTSELLDSFRSLLM